jgi:hypothetical protein
MTSVAPAATSYFLQLARNTLPDDAFVTLRKREATLVFTAPITLVVYGYSGNTDPAELSPQARREETFDINCCVTAFAGDNDLETRMSEAQVAYDAIFKAVGNDFRFGNLLRWAQMTEYTFVPDVDSNGMSIGQIEFRINCQQRIDSLT